MRHVNNGACGACKEIIEKFDGFDPELAAWFYAFQKKHTECHTSCAGRAEDDQELCFLNKSSKAHYGESAHNFNAALDLFENQWGDPKNIYESKWFLEILSPELPKWIQWGWDWKTFKEMPHIERKDWKEKVAEGKLKLVEPKRIPRAA